MWLLLLLLLFIAILTFDSTDNKVRKKRIRSKTPPRKSKREQIWTH